MGRARRCLSTNHVQGEDRALTGSEHQRTVWGVELADHHGEAAESTPCKLASQPMDCPLHTSAPSTTALPVHLRPRRTQPPAPWKLHVSRAPQHAQESGHDYPQPGAKQAKGQTTCIICSARQDQHHRPFPAILPSLAG